MNAHPRFLLILIAACGAASLAVVAQTQPAGAAAAPAPAQPAAPSAAAPAPTRGRGANREPMTSRVITWESLTPTPSATGSGRRVFDGPTVTLNNFECHITTVDVGKGAHAPHTHAREELLVVKEGTLEVYINGKTYLAPPGSIIYYSSNDQHGTKNVGKVPATYYVFNVTTDKTPANVAASEEAVKLGQAFYDSTGPFAPASGNTSAK